jgi:menaquinone-dependent protoporphyrinogen oxidase
MWMRGTSCDLHPEAEGLESLLGRGSNRTKSWPGASARREDLMEPTILVAYATKHGSTREVAEWVAETLRAHGLRTETAAAADVNTLEPYDGVVLGGALYMGRLHADARSFLRRHRLDLGRLSCAIFALGPGTSDEADLARSRSQLHSALAKVPEVKPIALAVFGGVVVPERLHFPFNRMPASDARDRSAVEGWAATVAAAYLYGKPAPPAGDYRKAVQGAAR